MGMRLPVIFALLCISLDYVEAEQWTHHTVLDGKGNFHLYWQPPDDNMPEREIIFKVEVKTKGYVGFGLSPNGGMAGSDIVMGWINNSQPYFQVKTKGYVGFGLSPNGGMAGSDIVTGWINNSQPYFEVKTKGYVGFGLSPNGGMAGSDIVMGWINNSQPYFQDRHGVGNNVPVEDESQDWKLIAAFENDTFTVFTFSRKLETCDEHDILIDESTMKVIYAYHDEDPTSENPNYHHENRGSKSIMLLQRKVKKNVDLDLSSLLQWNIESPEIDISSYTSLYWCKIYKTPKVSEKHHIVYVKPQIQEGHEQFVHHMLLYECVGGAPEEYESYLSYRGHKCHHPNMPDAMKKCEGVSIAWAVGGEDIVFPDHVGFPLDPDPGTYFMLEIHYDNQNRESGIIDHSGLTIYYTPNLRKYDAGCLMIGSTISPRLFIPPGQKEYVVVGHSSPDCLAPEFPKTGVKALGVLLHAHLLGRSIKARHFRGDQEIAPLAEDKNYDFNYQEYRYFPNEVEILPNDQITVECTYNSSGRKNVTYGGESTRDEMCLAFVLYYPRVKRYASLSVPTFDDINRALKTNYSHIGNVYYGLMAYDWTSINVRHVENILKNSEHTTHCYLGNGQKNSVSSLISYPTNLKAFVKDSLCSGSQSLMCKQLLFVVICVIILILDW